MKSPILKNKIHKNLRMEYNKHVVKLVKLLIKKHWQLDGFIGKINDLFDIFKALCYNKNSEVERYAKNISKH